jgi:CheY-like chemotaxis protein
MYMAKVLVVDDNPDMRYLLRVQLELIGFTAVAANNGKEAVEKATAEKPDLIVMDILMPEMDGREATQILRSTPQTEDIPILAITAMVLPSDLQTCIDAGCNDYIVKPFTWRQLRTRITALIAKKALH